jgi:hypothetical protein
VRQKFWGRWSAIGVPSNFLPQSPRKWGLLPPPMRAPRTSEIRQLEIRQVRYGKHPAQSSARDIRQANNAQSPCNQPARQAPPITVVPAMVRTPLLSSDHLAPRRCPQPRPPLRPAPGRLRRRRLALGHGLQGIRLPLMSPGFNAPPV